MSSACVLIRFKDWAWFKGTFTDGFNFQLAADGQRTIQGKLHDIPNTLQGQAISCMEPEISRGHKVIKVIKP